MKNFKETEKEEREEDNLVLENMLEF